MSEEKSIVKKEEAFMQFWAKPSGVQALFPDLNQSELNWLIWLGTTLRANPFTHEIWAVKYDKSRSAQIFLGLNKYRSRAAEHPEYSHHLTGVVYENDEFLIKDGIPYHEVNTLDDSERGNPIGAWCKVYKKNQDTPICVVVKFKEYDLQQSTWKKQPHTQIEKVAESQGLRKAFPSDFGGTYTEIEQMVIEERKKRKIEPPIIDIEAGKIVNRENAPPALMEKRNGLNEVLRKHYGDGDSIEAALLKFTSGEFHSVDQLDEKAISKVTGLFQRELMQGG